MTSEFQTMQGGRRLMPVRALVRRTLSASGAMQVAEHFARLVPRPLQRTSERYFDFPISRSIRSAPLLLIRIPKTASVSLSFLIYGRVEGIPHRTAQFYRTSDATFFTAATKLAVVRNPWTRLLSAYDFLHKDGTDLARPNPEVRRQMQRIKSFEHFVYDYVEPHADDLHKLDATLHSQYRYVCDADGALIIDNIFKMESMNTVEVFLKRHGIQAPFQHLNRSAVDASDLDDRRLSPRLVDVIGRIYQTDAVLFGYRWEG